MNFPDLMIFGNPLYEWIVAIAMGGTLLLVLVWLKGRLGVWSARTASRFDDYLAEIVAGTRVEFLAIISFYAGLKFLQLPQWGALLDALASIALLVQVALWGNRAIGAWLKVYPRRDAAAATTLSVLGFIARVALWSVMVLMMLDNLGFNVTTLVTSLGIGGVAVALAVQNILGDIFSSLSIAMDKPFVVGDFVIVGDLAGTVEYIGLKTTRIRSLGGEQIVFSNSDLLNSRIRNYKRMQERRVVFRFGVAYQTPLAKLERIPAMLREIVEAQDKTRFERAHFRDYGDASLNFEVVYFVLEPEHNLHMDIQQAINLALLRRFQQQHIEFASSKRPAATNQPGEHAA